MPPALSNEKTLRINLSPVPLPSLLPMAIWLTVFCLPSFSYGIQNQESVPKKRAELEIQFARDVRPILSNHCFACHGPDSENQESDLRLDQPQNWKEHLDEDGEGIIAPGNPEKSELIFRISGEDPDLQMPPEDFGKPLSEKQITILKQWIKQGANWQEHWAYGPLPKTNTVSIPKDRWIDHFIDKKLKMSGWKRSRQAEPEVLIRRLYLDLTGLPPTVAQADQFIKNPTDQNYRQIVDQLLQSPAHAEHLTSYWLDWVRFADTVGYHGDQEHPVWPYRDFVIKSFLTNRPFDEFSKLQIAGDLIAKNSSDGPLSEAIVASCYNRLLQTTHEGGAQDKEYRSKYLADRVRNFSEVWLGTTMGCAECHDHKFDPFTQKDFYSLGAFFADVLEKGSYDRISPNSTPTTRPPQQLVLSPLSVSSLSTEEKDAIKKALSTIKSKSNNSSHHQSIKQWRHQMAEQKKIDKSLQETVQKLNQSRKKSSTSMISIGQCMVTQSVEPMPVRVLPRGDWMDDSGEPLSSRPPVQFGNWSASATKSVNRKDLAEWLFRKQNPIVARVFVNRLWAIFFGKGLSENLGDLGAQGSWPTHPELLDQLSLEFQKSGWNVRHMVRLIVTSKTYRQSSDQVLEKLKSDPRNLLYWRQSPRRVRAETVRDIALSSCEILDKTIGGKSAKPYQPVGYYSNLNFPKRTYRSDKGAAQYRRGLYIHWQRQFLHPMLKAFDAPSREECTAERPVSNTPSAALVLLNDPTFLEAARNLAFSTLKSRKTDQDDREILSGVFRRIVTRKPSSQELDVLESALKKERISYRQNTELAKKILEPGTKLSDQVLKESNVQPHELAAWTQVVRIILNLDETITIY